MPSFDATDSFVAAAHGVWRRCRLVTLARFGRSAGLCSLDAAAFFVAAIHGVRRWLQAGTERRHSASWRGNLLKLQPWQICPVSLMLYPSEPINNNSGQFLEPLGRSEFLGVWTISWSGYQYKTSVVPSFDPYRFSGSSTMFLGISDQWTKDVRAKGHSNKRMTVDSLRGCKENSFHKAKLEESFLQNMLVPR
ncbi:hypothetical protein Tco_1578088 [Tanacetum coccineum]